MVMRFVFLFLTVLLLGPSPSLGQNKPVRSSRVSLEDVEIKGELNNDGRVDLLRRDRNDIASIIQIRRDFRAEIVRSIPTYYRNLDD